jgi:hypothetical protein
MAKSKAKIQQFEAKAKPEAWGSVRAFSGHEYVKYEWRPVPEGSEDVAKNHEMLEVREVVSESLIENVKGTADKHAEEIMEEEKSKRRKKKSEEAGE